MVRKYEKKTKDRKPNSKPIKKTKSKKGKNSDVSTQEELDYTLPEGNHLDSFDILRSDEHRVLKEKNELKKDVRASFNRDSSIEVDSDTSHSAVSLSTSSEILIQEKEQEENVDKSKFHIEQSINSENSYLFSKSVRRRRQIQKAEARAKIKPKKRQTAWLNISKAAFYVSPLTKYLKPKNIETSTPVKDTGVIRFGSFNSINVDNPQPTQTKALRTRSHQNNQLAQPDVPVEVRRLQSENRLSFSPAQIDQEKNDDNTIDDDNAAAISIASTSDTRSIIELEQSKPLYDSSIVTRSNIENDSITSNAHRDDKSDDIDKLESQQSIYIATTANDSSCCFVNSHDNHSNIKVFAEVHWDNKSNDVISVSSASCNQTTTSPSTTTAQANQPKMSIKTRVGFNTSNSIHEHSDLSREDALNPKIVIKGGKWRRTIFELRKNKTTQSPRRTLVRESDQKARQSTRQSRGNALRRKSIFIKDIPDRKTLNDKVPRKSQIVSVLDESDVESICSSDFSPKPTSINVLSKLRRSRLQPISDSVDFKRKSTLHLNNGSQLSLCNSLSVESALNEIENSTSSLQLDFNQDELKAQLLKRCGQTDLLPFDEIYSVSVLEKCQKIGEGVFGEVYLNESYVLKIIPIEGDVEINGAQQKRFDEILQEVIISQELSALRYSEKNRSAGFVEVLNVRLVEGRYPARLLDLWDDYDTRQVSENDRPDVFGDDQLYVVFELANCGGDLEAHTFKNAEQSYSAFKQVAISLAVAESQFEFEHRDLHWGNVLIAPTTEKSLTFYLNDKPIEVRTHGIKATIIDYTLSRIVYKNCCLFQDLAADPELFEASGDYQYDIYRLMRKETNNYWEVFEPYTNVLWLHYMVDKMIDGVNYTAKRAVKHRQFIDKMIKLRDEIQEYRSATDYIESDY